MNVVDMNHLGLEIEKKRKKLNKLAQRFDLRDQKVLKLSQELDLLIIEHMKQEKKGVV